MKKYLSLASAFFIMLCVGGVYAWSIFVPLLKVQLNFSTLQTQVIVGLTLGVFAFSMIFAGRFLKQNGPQKTSLIGAFFLLIGYLIAYFSMGNLPFLCLGIGIFCGIGTGFCYVSCLVTPTQNFPDHKGLATGIAVAGFGAGAILLSFLVKLLLQYFPQLQVLELFGIIGLVYGVIILVAIVGLQIDVAKPTSRVEENNFTFSFKNKSFIVLFTTMFCGTFAGLLILGNAKPIAISLGFDENVATLSISLLAIGNMSGRVVWGMIIDKIGVNKSLLAAYTILFFAVLTINFMPISNTLLYLVLILVGLGFSANFVLFAAKTTQLFGIEKLSLVYPYVFLAYGIAGVIGPFIGGWLFDINKNYSLALVISILLTALGAVVFQIHFRKSPLTNEVK